MDSVDDVQNANLEWAPTIMADQRPAIAQAQHRSVDPETNLVASGTPTNHAGFNDVYIWKLAAIHEKTPVPE